MEETKNLHTQQYDKRTNAPIHGTQATIKQRAQCQQIDKRTGAVVHTATELPFDSESVHTQTQDARSGALVHGAQEVAAKSVKA